MELLHRITFRDAAVTGPVAGFTSVTGYIIKTEPETPTETTTPRPIPDTPPRPIRDTTHADLSPKLDFRFDGVVLYWNRGDVVGVCRLSETRFYLLQVVHDAGTKGISFGEALQAVPEWDVEETDEGRIKTECSRVNTHLKDSQIPFHLLIERVVSEIGHNLFPFSETPLGKRMQTSSKITLRYGFQPEKSSTKE